MNVTTEITIPLKRSAIARLLSGETRFSRLWLCMAAALILGGAALRLTNVGKYGFWTEEYLHVFAAKSYLSSGQTYVPMVGEYTRASTTTYLTAAMFKLFGESEATARLPFVVISILFLGLSALIVRRLFSETVSAAYLFVMAFAPVAIEISRWCRFYSVHQLFYFLTAAALFAGFENSSGRLKGNGHKAPIDWRWLVLSAPLAAVAFHFHPLTVNLGATALCYLVVMAALMVGKKGWWLALRSKYAITLFLAAAATAVLYRLRPDVFTDLLQMAAQVSSAPSDKANTANFYRYYFVDKYPALTFLFPVGAYVGLRRYGKGGLFAACASAPILLMHAFIFARRSERYVFYLFPFFVITAVIALEPFLQWGWTRFRVHLKSEPLRSKLMAAAFLLPGLLVLVHPWLIEAARVPFRASHPDWKSLDGELKRSLRRNTVLTTNPHAFLYYVGKYPEYYRLSEIQAGHAYEPTLVHNERGFSEVLHMRGELYFIGAEWNFNNDGYLGPDTRNAVQYLMSPVDHSGDRRILAYHK